MAGIPEGDAPALHPAEEKFVRTFLPKGVRERWLQFLLTPRQRGKMLRRLAHVFDGDLDSRFLYDPRDLPPDIAAKVSLLLSRWKAANPKELCHIIGDAPTPDGSDSDGQSLPLSQIMGPIYDTNGVVIILLPDQLAYYRREDSLNKEPYLILFRERNAESRPT